MHDIEFVPDQPDEELHDAGARRRPPWLIPLALALIVVVAVIVALNRHSASAPTAGAPSSAPGTADRTAADGPLPAGLGPGSGSVGDPVDAGANVLDVAVSGDTWWELQPRQILRYDQAGVQAHGRLPFVVSDHDQSQIVLDLPTDRLWLVISGRQRSRLVEFDDVRLRPTRSLALPGTVNSAAALDGTLYLTAGSALIRVPPHGRMDAFPMSEERELGAIVTDSARGGLVMADLGTPSRLWRVTPRPGGRVHIAAPVTVPVIKPTLAVANGAIWLGGYANSGAVLERLNPTTLKPVVRSPLRTQLGPGAVLVAGGVLDVWVRSGGGGSDLHCIDAAAGNPLQKWDILGPVSSGGGTALVATADGAVPLDLTNCSG